MNRDDGCFDINDVDPIGDIGFLIAANPGNAALRRRIRQVLVPSRYCGPDPVFLDRCVVGVGYPFVSAVQHGLQLYRSPMVRRDEQIRIELPPELYCNTMPRYRIVLEKVE